MVKHKTKNGYLQKFRYNMTWGDHGIPGEIIEWCRKNCKGNWGWWFHENGQKNEWHPENYTAYVSFSRKRDYMKFWIINCRLLEQLKKQNQKHDR